MSIEIQKIQKVSKAFKQVQQIQAPDKSKFDDMMRKAEEKIEATKAHQTEGLKAQDQQTQQRVQETQKIDDLTAQRATEARRKPTLIEEVRNLHKKVDRVSKGTPEQLVAQARDVIEKIETLKNQLGSPDLKLKGSTQTMLRNKLSHIDDNLKVALENAGVEFEAPKQFVSPATKPIETFLGYLTNGQEQLKTLASEVGSWSANKGEISPAKMLMVQVKVGMIQHELEFFANLLNKSLESTKTIMNVQV